VEYSPGQEGWVDLAFERVAANSANKASFGNLPSPALPALAFANFTTHREERLESIAQQIGLNEPTDLQRRTFDTFLGYYELLTETAEGNRTARVATSRSPASCHLAP
jgi:hypothetical protein